MELADWIHAQLSELLSFPVSKDLTDYIMAIENTRDLEEYLANLLDFNDTKTRHFFTTLLQKRQSGQKKLSSDVQSYRKSDIEEVYVQPKNLEKKKKSKGHVTNETNQTSKDTHKEQEEKKKKAKFINLYSQEGRMKDFILLKGRHHCDCQATKHKLINNCLECGRIVCEQEGSGPCFFCNNMVCTQQEKEILLSTSKEGEELFKKLVSEKKNGLDSAIEQRNRLLEYDRTSEKRTKVIDDESDYFALNSVWLSPAERERLKNLEHHLHASRHASRLDKKMTLDFAGRQVLEEDCNPVDVEKYIMENEYFHDTVNVDDSVHFDSTVHPRLTCEKPVFQEPADIEFIRNKKQRNGKELTVRRVQDKEFLEMTDDGACLSMHQPWASLLVLGIKQHEGRVWYHPHRGRLWIAATAKPPDPEEIKKVEQMYRVLNNEELKFPSQYPVSCLLGCVTVIDCLPQEDYHVKYPDGESDSPFVFICENPKELPIKFPIQGKHKIYKLDKKIHEAAQKALERMARIKATIAHKLEND